MCTAGCNLDCNLSLAHDEDLAFREISGASRAGCCCGVVAVLAAAGACVAEVAAAAVVLLQ